MREEAYRSELAAIQDALHGADLPFEVLAVLLFGSRARGKAGGRSDTDLLVVGQPISELRQRRIEEIILIRRLLPVSAADILLLTAEEVRSNFENHNPLFLDMAEEGILLFDKTGLIQSLMDETKNYIRVRGIRRYGEGWMFPVEQGKPTPLSRVTNEDFSWAMIRDGERDLEIGRQLTGNGFYDKAVYHFQQAVEKAVKGILIALGVFQKTHFVGEILKDVVRQKNLSDPWASKLVAVGEISERMEPHVSLSRYPGIQKDRLWLPSEEYGVDEAREAGHNAEEACACARQFLSHWFGTHPL